MGVECESDHNNEIKEIRKDNDVKNERIKATTSTRRKKKFDINIHMLPTKFTYLLWGGVVGTYHVFMIPFLKDVGLTVSQAGIITGVIAVTFSFASPFWGMVTDYTGYKKTILTLLCLIAAPSISLLPLVAISMDQNTLSNRTCNHNTTVTYDRCGEMVKDSNDCLEEKQKKNNDLFHVFLVLITLSSVFFGIVPGYIESIALSVVKTSHVAVSYGAQRIFGSIGSCVAVYLTGIAADHIHIAGLSKYSVPFILYVPFVLMMIPMGCCLITQASRQERRAINDATCTKHATTETSDNNASIDDKSILKHLYNMFRQIDVIFFLLTVFVSGVAFCTFIYYTILLINEELGDCDVTKSDSGLVYSIASASSIVMFPFTAKIIKLLHGPMPTISLGISSYCVRYIIMSYARTYWVIAGAQLLNALGWALLWAATMEHVDVISPRKIKVTMILIVQSVHFGVAPLVLNTVGAKIYEIHGGRTLFRCVGGLCGIWGLLSYVKYYGSIYLNHRDVVRSNRGKDTSVAEVRLIRYSSSKGLEGDTLLVDAV